MGLLDGLKMKRDQEAITAALPHLGAAGDPSTFPIATPWGQTGNLEQIFFQDVFGTDGPPVASRTSAMRVPAIKRARGLLCQSVSRNPLRVADRTGLLPPEQQPTWLYRTDRTSPRTRIVWTVDDLIFYGVSCWWVERGHDGFPLRVERLNQGTWYVDADLKVNVNGSPVRDDQVLLFTGYDEGILAAGRDALADVKSLYWIVRDRLRNPIALTELHQKGGPQLNETEIAELLEAHRTARAKAGGNLSYSSENIETITHGADASDAPFLIEARNAAAVDMARLVGVSAGMLDATAPKASLNYETQAGRNLEFRDLDLDFYMGPIQDRLSMDDCVPRTQHVVFDTTAYTAPVDQPAGPQLED